jgi:hypothetical protein
LASLRRHRRIAPDVPGFLALPEPPRLAPGLRNPKILPTEFVSPA